MVAASVDWCRFGANLEMPYLDVYFSHFPSICSKEAWNRLIKLNISWLLSYSYRVLEKYITVIYLKAVSYFLSYVFLEKCDIFETVCRVAIITPNVPLSYQIKVLATWNLTYTFYSCSVNLVHLENNFLGFCSYVRSKMKLT